MDRLDRTQRRSVAVREMRKHLAWYLKGLPDSAVVKDSIMEQHRAIKMVSASWRILSGFLGRECELQRAAVGASEAEVYTTETER